MLYIYKELTPNTDMHYYFTNIANYKTELSTNLVTSLTPNNYRINANVCKLKLDETITEKVADTITYIIDERTSGQNTTYFRAYFVDNIYIQSGYVILNLSVDLWASYIYKASIDNILIKQTNCRLAMYGKYRNIENTFGNVEVEYLTRDLDTISLNDLELVFVVNYLSRQSVFGNTADTQVVCKNIGELETQVRAQIGTRNIFEYCIHLAQNITTIGGSDASILHAYIIPSELISKTTEYLAINFTADYTAQMNMFKVTPTVKSKELEIENYNVNYKYFGGSKIGDGLELDRLYTYSDKWLLYYVCQVDLDEINFFCYQGDRMADITKNFELPVSVNDSNLNGFQKLNKALGIMTKGVSAGLSFTGNNTIMAGVGSVVSLLGDLIPQGKAPTLLNAGNALYTFLGTSYNNASNPYFMSYYVSAFNETEYLEKRGIFYAQYISDISDLFVTTWAPINNAPIYVQAQCYVNNAPLEACGYIENKFANGIYIKSL